MSTRSAIILKLKDGTYSGIYCHSDGYISGVGKVLQEHYKTYDKVKELISLGSISQLCPNITPTTKEHNFNHPEKGVVIAYHRDRGEDWKHVKPINGNTIEKVANMIDNEYVYVFDGKWTVNDEDLKKAITDEENI